ncbi:recombinase family protein [Frigoribacterium sp. 2-23]|uniref:recombinase family protein n=1 Tax=Frigoribacterium sp. 2-23 TaxID=3415006 RepID=UPI003C701695
MRIGTAADADDVSNRPHTTGTTRARPGLREALAACSPGNVRVATKLDRLARLLRDASDIADELTS